MCSIADVPHIHLVTGHWLFQPAVTKFCLNQLCPSLRVQWSACTATGYLAVLSPVERCTSWVTLISWDRVNCTSSGGTETRLKVLEVHHGNFPCHVFSSRQMVSDNC